MIELILAKPRSRIIASMVKRMTVLLAISLIFSGCGGLSEVIDTLPASPTPDFGAASQLFGQASKLISEEKFQEALPLLEDAVELSPKDHLAWEGLALVYFQLGQYPDSIEAIETSLGIDESNASAWNILGATRLELGQCEQALPAFQKAIDLDISFAGAYSNMGNCYQDLGQYDKAVDAFGRAISIDPNDASYYYNRGNTYEASGNCENALSDYETAVSLDPNHADAYNNMSRCYQALGQYEEAIKNNDDAIHIRPDAQLYTNKSDILREMKRYEEALDAAQKAIALDEDFALAYSAQGTIYLLQGKLEDAIASFDIGLTKDNSKTTIWHNLGVAYYMLEEFEKAANAWREIIDLGNEGPEYAGALNNVASIYADKLETNLEEALQFAQRAVGLADTNSQKASYLDTLAWVHYKLGQCDEALKTIEEAVTFDENDTGISERLAIIKGQCNP